jgi:prophage antirepressor-like protein
MSDLIPLIFHGHQIAMHLDEHGDPWWWLVECAKVAGIVDVHRAAERIDPEDRRKAPGLARDGKYRDSWLINESGLYMLLMRSNKPEARAFQRWVTKEVLPSLRKTGRYETASPVERYPELKAIMQLVQEIADTRVKAEAAQALATEAKANADLALQSQQWLTIREYVYVHGLHRQCPEHYWGDLGRYLTGYCLDHNIPVRAQGVGDRRYTTEHAYHVEVMHRLVPQWMARQTGQSSLRMLAREQPPDGEESS